MCVPAFHNISTSNPPYTYRSTPHQHLNLTPRLKASEDFSSSHAPRTFLTFLLIMAAFSRQLSITSINLATWKESSFSLWLLLETVIRLHMQQTYKRKKTSYVKLSDVRLGFIVTSTKKRSQWVQMGSLFTGSPCYDIRPVPFKTMTIVRGTSSHVEAIPPFPP